jgi:hypothetical protein
MDLPAGDILTAATLAAETAAHERAVIQAQYAETFEWLAARIAQAQAAGEPVNLKVPRKITLLVDQLNDVTRECHAAGLKNPYDSNLVDSFALRFQEHVRSLWPPLPVAANASSLPSSSPVREPTASSSTPTVRMVLNCPRAIQCCLTTAAGIRRDLYGWYSPKLVASALTDLGTKELSDDIDTLTLTVFEHWYRLQWVLGVVVVRRGV